MVHCWRNVLEEIVLRKIVPKHFSSGPRGFGTQHGDTLFFRAHLGQLNIPVRFPALMQSIVLLIDE